MTNYFFEETNGFVVLLDIHFGKKCNIRLDNTEDVIEDKINQIISYCNDNNVKIVFIAGDIFDSCSIGRKEFIRAYNILKKFKDNNIELVTIYGNHDEYRYNPNYRKDTPLNDLVNMEIIKTIDSEDKIVILTNDNIGYNIYGFPYVETQKLKEKRISYKDRISAFQVIIGHTFYDNEFMGGENNITDDDLESINCDYLILGHDHSYYEPERVFNTEVFRFGSLVRGTSSANDLQRKVKFMHLYGDGEWKEVALDVQDLKEVTTAKATVKEDKIDFNELIEEIKIVESETNNIDSVMESINNLENEQVKEIIRRNI